MGLNNAFFLNIYTFTNIKQEFIKKKLYEKDKASTCNTIGHNTLKHQINATVKASPGVRFHIVATRGRAAKVEPSVQKRKGLNTRRNATATYTATLNNYCCVSRSGAERAPGSTGINRSLIVE